MIRTRTAANTPTRLSIIIVGAGMGGLTAASDGYDAWNVPLDEPALNSAS